MYNYDDELDNLDEDELEELMEEMEELEDMNSDDLDTLRRMDEIRRKLEDYYGTAMFSGMPMAMLDLEDVKRKSPDELRKEAKKLGLI